MLSIGDKIYYTGCLDEYNGLVGTITAVNAEFEQYELVFGDHSPFTTHADNVRLAQTVASRAEVEQVNSPSHYTWLKGFEVIDFSEQFNFNLGNVIKYVARSGRKTEDPIRDLKKARWYLTRELERIQKESN